MPRYFIHVRGPNFYTEDTKGVEIADEEKAWAYAARVAEDLGERPEYGLHTVVLTTERGVEIARIPVLRVGSTKH